MNPRSIKIRLETHRKDVFFSARNAICRFEDGCLTRADVAEILAKKFPSAFIHVGGGHVAVHADGAKFGRDLLITSPHPDWS
jgi:hypothetical protein